MDLGDDPGQGIPLEGDNECPLLVVDFGAPRPWPSFTVADSSLTHASNLRELLGRMCEGGEQRFCGGLTGVPERLR